MPTTTSLIAFGVAAGILIAIPGPSVLFVIGRALALGRTGALLSVIGNAAGVFVQVVAIALGVGAIIQASVVIFTVIKLAGALFLVYLGVQAIRHRKRVTARAGTAPRGWLRTLAEGVLVGISNPKSVVFFIAVLPQFVSVGTVAHPAGPAQLQLLVLGAVFVGIALVFDSIWALAASGARAWFARSPRRIEALGATGGVAMIGLGGVLAFTGSKH